MRDGQHLGRRARGEGGHWYALVLVLWVALGSWAVLERAQAALASAPAPTIWTKPPVPLAAIRRPRWRWVTLGQILARLEGFGADGLHEVIQEEALRIRRRRQQRRRQQRLRRQRQHAAMRAGRGGKRQ